MINVLLAVIFLAIMLRSFIRFRHYIKKYNNFLKSINKENASYSGLTSEEKDKAVEITFQSFSKILLEWAIGFAVMIVLGRIYYGWFLGN